MNRLSASLIGLLVSCPIAALASDVEKQAMGEAVERHMDVDYGVTQWVQDPGRLDEEQGDQVETREVVSAMRVSSISLIIFPIPAPLFI